MKFVKGPIFGNIILGDEINRTPPKTQAAMLQAMQEYQVTIAGQTFELPRPFLVLGTQNPIEQEGTYPLPEAQLDRFMFRIQVDYPTFEEELQIAETTTSQDKPDLNAMLDGTEIMQLQQVVRKVIVSKSIASYAVRLVRATRPDTDESPEFIKQYLTWGAGPRACQALLMGAKANALLEGRFNASIEDIRYVAFPVLRHRLVTSFSAESDSVSTDTIVERLCKETSEEF
jgi:MoxR-like ATPase